MLSVVEMRQAFLHACRLQEPSLKKTTKYFQVSDKEQELSSWEPSAYIVFMHELLTVEIHHFIVHVCAAVYHLRCVILFIW